jgi:hypothetical protein
MLSPRIRHFVRALLERCFVGDLVEIPRSDRWATRLVMGEDVISALLMKRLRLGVLVGELGRVSKCALGKERWDGLIAA